MNAEELLSDIEKREDIWANLAFFRMEWKAKPDSRGLDAGPPEPEILRPLIENRIASLTGDAGNGKVSFFQGVSWFGSPAKAGAELLAGRERPLVLARAKDLLTDQGMIEELADDWQAWEPEKPHCVWSAGPAEFPRFFVAPNLAVALKEILAARRNEMPQVNIEQEAKHLLISKEEILDVLRVDNSKWQWVLKLKGCPISTKQGGHAMVEKKVLISWWNKVCENHEMLKEEKQAFTDDGFPHQSSAKPSRRNTVSPPPPGTRWPEETLKKAKWGKKTDPPNSSPPKI